MSEPLRQLLRHVAAAPPFAQLARQREAERLGLTPAAWLTVRDAPIDLVLLRALHRAATGARVAVRRASPDGGWSIAAPRAGHLRSRPQSFRAGDHVEAAWDHNTLTRRLAALLNAPRAADPIVHAAALAHTIVRAQPFLGDNERSALLLAACLLSAAGLPALCLEALERDARLTTALIAPSSAPLAALLAEAVWDEAVALAEWLTLPRPAAATRWTLADEHAALAAARSHIPSIAPDLLAAIAAQAATAIEATLPPSLGDPANTAALAWTPLTTFAARLRVTIDSAQRGRQLCVQHPIHEARWRTASGPSLVLVAGTAGRGLSGAATLHLALDSPAAPYTAFRAAPALLLVPDEPATDQHQRLTSWATATVPRVLAS